MNSFINSIKAIAINPGSEKAGPGAIFCIFRKFSQKLEKSGRIIPKNHPFRNPNPDEAGFMIDKINYFPERENYQNKKKADEDWKELKKQKIVQDSKKSNRSDKPKPPDRKK